MMSMLQIVLANIEQTKPFAVLLAGGKQQKKERKKRKTDPEQSFKDSIVLPSEPKK